MTKVGNERMEEGMSELGKRKEIGRNEMRKERTAKERGE